MYGEVFYMKKFILFASVLFLSACMSNMNLENPFSSTTNVQNVYISQFPDVPIPADMKQDAKNTITTISSNGEKIGKEVLTGRVEHNSLGAAMAHNLQNQGWVMVGIVQGKATLQLYNKASRYLIVLVEDGNFSSKLTLWMINQVDGQGGFLNNVQDLFMEESPSFEQENVTPLMENSLPQTNYNTSNQEAITQNAGYGQTQQNYAIQEVEAQMLREQQASQNTPSNNFDSFGDNSLFK